MPAPHRKALALASFELVAAHDGPPRVASGHAGQARVAPCTARACRRLPRSRPSSRISHSSAGTGHRTFLHPASGLPGETYAQFDSSRVHGGVGRWGSRGDLQPIRRMDLDPPAQATAGRLAAPMARLNAWTARVALGLSVNPAREPVHAGCLVMAREARGAGELASGSHKEQENHTNPATGACRAES